MKNLLLLILILISSAALPQVNPIKYVEVDQVFNGAAIIPKKTATEKPGVLIIPGWMGIDDHTRAVAEKLANLGIYTFIADIYGEGNYPKNKQEAGKIAGYYKQHRVEYQKRVALALAQLIKTGANSSNIVVLGYCFGAAGALDAARTNMKIRGAISVHGVLARDETTAIKPISDPILVLHGADDPNVPKAEVEAFQMEMRDTKADWQMIYYSDAVHAFTDPAAGNDKSKGAAYNDKQAKRAWEHIKVFLAEVLLH